MPHMFPSGQFPPGACGQVRPVGATLPTAARRALPLVKPRTATHVHRPRTAVPQGNTSLQDRRVLPQGQAAATPAWTGGVDNLITRTLSNIHLQQEQPTTIPAWTYGVGNGCVPSHTCKHEKESPDDLSSEDSFKARRLPTLPPGLAVPSAMTGLASLFGMGRGGSPSL